MSENSSPFVTTVFRKGERSTHNFKRITDAILFVVREFDTGDGDTERAEIHRGGTLVWRRSGH